MDEFSGDITEDKVEAIKKDLKDTKKINELIEKFKKDKSIVPNVLRTIEEDQQLKRNTENLARMLAPTGQMGQEVPLSDRKKMAARQELLRSMAKHKHMSGDVSCVVILINGKIQSTIVNIEDITNDKWVLHPVVLGGKPFAAMCNSSILKDNNKKVSKILGMTTYGPVKFLLMDVEYNIVNITVPEFNKYLCS